MKIGAVATMSCVLVACGGGAIGTDASGDGTAPQDVSDAALDANDIGSDAPGDVQAMDSVDGTDATDAVTADVTDTTDTTDTTDSGPPPMPTQIKGGLSGPGSIASDGTNVFVATCNGDIDVMGVDGTGFMRLAMSQGCVNDVAAHAGTVYWVSPSMNTAWMATVSPASRSNLSSAESGPHAIAVSADGADVFWTNMTSGVVRRDVLASGAGPSDFAPSQAMPSDIAVDATNVYWTNRGDGTVASHALTSGVTNTIAMSQAMPDAIAVFNGTVYWMNTGGTQFQLMALAPGASGPTPVGAFAMGATQPGVDLAVDGTGIYVADSGSAGNGDGRILRWGLDGSGPAVLAQMQATPRGIAIDATYVYWTNGSSGTVMRLPK